jgi:Capsule polysaccharide biosynthesis protein
MKIFFFFSILHKLYGEVAKELRRRDPAAKFSGILYGRDQVRDLQNRNFPSGELCVFTEELRKPGLDSGMALDFLSRWERQQGIPFSIILAADRCYSGFPREQGLRIAADAIRICQTLLDRIRPDAIVAEGIDDLLSHVLYCSARERGIPYLITYASPTPNRIAIYGNPDNHWEKVEEIFLHLKERALTTEQRKRAATLLREYREKHLLPMYLQAGFNRLFSGRELYSVWRLLRQRWLDPAYQLDPSYGGGVTRNVARKLQRVFRARLGARRYFQSSAPQERFVFFPLQMEPECSTLVFAPFHANQPYLIECLSKSLPIDHLLYVKEHPVMVGRRPLSFYRTLSSLPNVRLIAPRVSSHDLIRRASAVVTITSSVGWEALVHAKPVIVMGNVWYDACDLVRKVRATADLPAALQWALTQYKPDEELLLKFVAASLEGTYPGRIEHPDYTPEVLSGENAAAIASAICQHLEWLRSHSLPCGNEPVRAVTDDPLPELRPAAAGRRVMGSA